MFELHPQLAADCIDIGDLPLCRLLLSKDANYPWCILVPRREAIQEIYQLTENDQLQLLKESSALSKVMQDRFKARKMNVAALGNMVPQLHLHHIARYGDDAAWPGPVWGKVEPQVYDEARLQQHIRTITDGLAAQGFTL